VQASSPFWGDREVTSSARVPENLTLFCWRGHDVRKDSSWPSVGHRLMAGGKFFHHQGHEGKARVGTCATTPRFVAEKAFATGASDGVPGSFDCVRLRPHSAQDDRVKCSSGFGKPG
jgi:hypothetical protein